MTQCWYIFYGQGVIIIWRRWDREELDLFDFVLFIDFPCVIDLMEVAIIEIPDFLLLFLLFRPLNRVL